MFFPTILLTSDRISFFTSNSSKTASMTKSETLISSILSIKEMFPLSSFNFISLILFFINIPSRMLKIFFSDFSRLVLFLSNKNTLKPAFIKLIAMPVPIVPAPRIEIVLMSSIFFSMGGCILVAALSEKNKYLCAADSTLSTNF